MSEETTQTKTRQELLDNDQVYGWVSQISGMEEVIPPFCIEMNLTDGSRYFLHSIPTQDEQTMSLILRVWDLRAFSEKELVELRSNLNHPDTLAKLMNSKKIHPNLDYADIRLHLANINYVIEWNDQVWPREERPQLGLIG